MFWAQGLGGVFRGLTVEEGSGVDAGARGNTCQIPHLLQGPALRQRYGQRDDQEERVEDDHGHTGVAEGRCDGEPEVHEQDGELDEVDGAVVRALDRERDL